jgi:hypothetical protein
MGLLTGWKYRKKITIDGTKIDANLTDFPITVFLNSSRFDFSKARSDGFDIRFTDSDGVTLLKYERERHDAANQLAEYHVKIPSLSAGQNKTIYMYYGNSSASDGADPTNVWDANFIGVYHLKETTGNFNSSTTTNYYGVGAGGITRNVSGQVDGAVSFNGSNGEIYIDDMPNIMGNWTIEVFLKRGRINSATEEVILGKNSDMNFFMRILTNNTIDGYFHNGTTWQAIPASTNQMNSTTVFYYWVFRRSGNTLEHSVNNVVWTSGTTSGNPATGSQRLTLGRSASASQRWFQGILDEVRISNVSRSNAWIKASYHSLNDSLLSYGVEEDVEGGLVEIQSTVFGKDTQIYKEQNKLVSVQSSVLGKEGFMFDERGRFISIQSSVFETSNRERPKQLIKSLKTESPQTKIENLP